ncbi:MAG TPA: DUF2799 domain-containing protein [Thermohalobaculum sp.]|nr:DUF2799 domain-containing protein [Thermohalobaculum sp.]
MRPHAGLTLALSAILLSGCTILSPAERAAACDATDWETFGYNDGLLGVPVSRRASRFADCAKLGVPADLAAYDAARAQGLQEYCTVENGYEVGYSGRRYRGVCPPDLAPSFIQGYDQGRRDRPPPRPSYHFGFGVGHYWHHHSIFDRHRHF